MHGLHEEKVDLLLHMQLRYASDRIAQRMDWADRRDHMRSSSCRITKKHGIIQDRKYYNEENYACALLYMQLRCDSGRIARRIDVNTVVVVVLAWIYFILKFKPHSPAHGKPIGYNIG